MRFRFEHHTHQLGITGLDAAGELRQLVARSAPRSVRHLQSVNLPIEGILISTKFAELLHIQLGEMLTVEVLEAERPTRSVAIAVELKCMFQTLAGIQDTEIDLRWAE